MTNLRPLKGSTLLALFCAGATILSLICAPAAARSGYTGLRYGFYRRSCPNVEKIIYKSVLESFKKGASIAPGVLRLAYHDCFVRGCDASVLLAGSNSERASAINAGLHGFDAVDAAKAAVEKACPGVVSCADVLQYAVRDTVILTGGHSWPVLAGRRDGRVSISSEVRENIVSPKSKVPVLLAAFQKKGLSAAQMVALTGAHTIGKVPCFAFDDRLWTYDSPSKVDPTLPASFAVALKKECPAANLTTRVDLEVMTPTKFDTQFFKNLKNSLGLLTSDQSMGEDSRTKGEVESNIDSHTFTLNFVEAMIVLSKIGVLTGPNSGEIRRHCSVVN